MSLFPAYGFGCGISRPRNVLGKVAAYIDTLNGVRTDAGVLITGTGGVVKANEAERGVELQAVSFPQTCFVTSSCSSCSGS
jgi:hypothetical protein